MIQTFFTVNDFILLQFFKKRSKNYLWTSNNIVSLGEIHHEDIKIKGVPKECLHFVGIGWIMLGIFSGTPCKIKLIQKFDASYHNRRRQKLIQTSQNYVTNNGVKLLFKIKYCFMEFYKKCPWQGHCSRLCVDSWQKHVLIHTGCLSITWILFVLEGTYSFWCWKWSMPK